MWSWNFFSKPEIIESPAGDTDSEAKKKQAKDTERDERRKAAAVYRYLETFEETKLMDKQAKATPSFIKPYKQENADNDWQENHYFYQDKPDGKRDENCGIILTSYQLDRLEEICNKTTYKSPPFSVLSGEKKPSGDSVPHYITLEKITSPAPVQKISENKDVKGYLEDLIRNNTDEFSGCELLSDALERLSLEDLEGAPDAVLDFARIFWKALVDQKLKESFKTFHDWFRGSIDIDRYEMVMGIGHVRQIFSSNRKREKEPEVMKIISSPLIEVLVRIEHCHDSGSIMVVPQENARLKWNAEAKSVLLTTGGGKEAIAEMHRLFAKGNVEKIIPNDQETFVEYLKKASELHYNGSVRETTEVHAPPDEIDSLVLSGGWCLFARPKRSTINSRDANAIAKAIDKGTLELSPPIRSLVQDPETTPSNSMKAKETTLSNSTDTEAATGDPADFLVPLPASQSQRQIMKSIFSKQSPVTVMRGPPGTGKTQTGVNTATLELQRGGTALVSSPNTRALEAFVEKVPQKLRMFCVDMASMEEGGMTSLCRALECMQIDFTNMMERKDEYVEEIKLYEKQIVANQEALSVCFGDLSSFGKANKRLMKIGGFNKIVKNTLEPNREISTVVSSALQYTRLDELFASLVGLVKDQHVEKKEFLKLDICGLQEISRQLIECVDKKRDTSDTSPEIEALGGRRLVSTYRTGSINSVQEELDKIKVGKGETFEKPTSIEEWDRVFRGLKLKKDLSDFHENHVKHLLALGCSESQVYDGDGTIRDEFVDTLTMLNTALAGVSEDDLKTLRGSLSVVSKNKQVQAKIKQLSREIQGLEADLLFAKVAHMQSKSITPEDLGKLNQLAQLAGKMKSSDAQSTKQFSGKAVRRNLNFEKAFREGLSFMRLVVMTPEQVSRFVPVNHRFGLVLVDEASQASCTALTMMVRAEQMVVIGDDKQVCPDEHNWSDEALNALDASLPDIISTRADNLKPRHSFFNLCQVSFTLHSAFLQDHFRCPPDGIAWSSENLYHRRINTYKPSGNGHTLLAISVDGKMKAKTNEVEAKKIVEFLINHLKKQVKAAVYDDDNDDDDCPVLTYGVISMAGNDQCKKIQELLDEELAPLCRQYGKKKIDQHGIKIGVPSQFQGSEKDVILISCVHDPTSVKPEDDQESQKVWNVATTRHRCQSVLFHSYDPQDKKIKLPVADHKHEIFAQYTRGDRTPKGEICWKKRSHDTRGTAERNLYTELRSRGFVLSRNEGNVWNDALTIGVKGGSISKRCVLVILENYGESDDDWSKIVDQQQDLEQGGTACLRVDTIALSLRFREVLDDIVEFLKESGLVPAPLSASVVELPGTAAVAAAASSPTENVFMKVSESSSDSESTLSGSQSIPSGAEKQPQRKRRAGQKKVPALKRGRAKK